MQKEHVNNMEVRMKLYQQGLSRQQFVENLYAPFLSLVKPGGRILDLGCGSGRDSKNFIQKGYEVEAVDSSPTLCRLASDYIGREVICQDMEEIEYRDEFDGTWACASLVHITKKEIHKMLEKLTCALGKTGVLYMSLKYGQGEAVKSGRFLVFMMSWKCGKYLRSLKVQRLSACFKRKM